MAALARRSTALKRKHWRRLLRRGVSGGRGRCVISLTFDDATADHLEAGRLLAEHGLCGTFYVNSNLIGSDGRLGWDGVRELAAAGHEIGGHTCDHVDLSGAAEAEASAQIANDRRALSERGLDARSFAYPYGALNETARALVAAAGYASARRAWGLAGDERHARTELLPPADAYAIRTVPSFERGTTLDELRGFVLRGEGAGGWLPLVFHGVSAGEGAYDLTRDVFRRFVEWLSGRLDRVDVCTVGDVVETG
jgi:peptidoglycan/xylan/chitin deacetylase (PgdA/CDA1 family)